MSGRSREPGRSVVSKAFAILDALRMAETGLTRAQLARRTGLPATTVHRLASELRDLGVLDRTDEGLYRVGPWVWEVGTLTASTSTLREVALPYMQDLYEATHENVQLAVLDGLDALVVERIRGPRSIPIATRLGGRLPLHATGVGKVLLAWAAPDFIEQVVAAGLAAYTASTITDPEALRRDLDAVRRHGYSLTRDEMTSNTISVGVPLRLADSGVIAALSLVVPGHHADVASLVPPVRAVGLGLSRQLGHLRELAVRPVPGSAAVIAG